MLIGFRVGNYKSFGSEQILSLESTGLKGLQNNIAKFANKKRVLKSSAIYGANASGKSNLISAFRTVVSFIKGEHIEIIPFVTMQDENLTEFEIMFIQSNKKFRYGFNLIGNNIINEWLFHTPNKREVELFTRESQNVKASKHFPEAMALQKAMNDSGISMQNDKLFLSSLISSFYSVGDSILNNLIDWFDKVECGTRKDFLGKTVALVNQNKYNDEINNFLKSAGIDGFTIDDSQIKFKHKINREQFEMEYSEESKGIQNLFGLSGVLCNTLKNGGILIIDDIDLHLHSVFTRELVQLFHSKVNKNNAQLIFTSHDTSLLSKEIFRRDQINFIEKEYNGESRIYSLANLKTARRDATKRSTAYEKNYLEGRYKAIPNYCYVEECFK